MTSVEHIAGRTWHGRRGAVTNAFAYGIDYVLVEPEAAQLGPRLFARNRVAPMAVHDVDHGGAPGQGTGAAWMRAVLADRGLAAVTGGRLLLLAQPRVLGHVFNPVSFWLAHDASGALRVVLAEVGNTFGDRHGYLCHRADLAAITPADTLQADKVFHVSPFRRIAGRYAFTFDIGPAAIAIRIEHRPGDAGEALIATLTGPRMPLTNRRILGAMLRRPFGSRRVLALIHWQALVLWWKGARYVPRPDPPRQGVTGGRGAGDPPRT